MENNYIDFIFKDLKIPPKKSEDSKKGNNELKISDFIVKKIKPIKKNEVTTNEAISKFTQKENEIDNRANKENSNNTGKSLEKENHEDKDMMKIGNKKNFILHKQ